MSIGNEFLKSVITRSSYYKTLSEKAMEQLEETDLYFMPNPESNSIAIIIQHMSGNMLSRWTNFLSEDGEKEWRSRDKEFNSEKHERKELMETWEKGWSCFLGALQSLTGEDLLKTIYIRREPLLVIDAINRQLAHYPHHAGQIVYIAKMIKGEKWKSLSIEKGRSEEFNKQYGKQM